MPKTTKTQKEIKKIWREIRHADNTPEGDDLIDQKICQLCEMEMKGKIQFDVDEIIEEELFPYYDGGDR